MLSGNSLRQTVHILVLCAAIITDSSSSIGKYRASSGCALLVCACAVPADANVLVTCRRLSGEDAEVVEIGRDDTATSAYATTTATTKGVSKLTASTALVIFRTSQRCRRLSTTGAVPANQPISAGEATDRCKSLRRKMADCPSK